METQLVQLLPDRATFGALILKRQVSQGSSGELWSKRVVLLSECDEVFGVWWGDGSCRPRKLMGIVRIGFFKEDTVWAVGIGRCSSAIASSSVSLGRGCA